MDASSVGRVLAHHAKEQQGDHEDDREQHD
jgi:hypothetical protein